MNRHQHRNTAALSIGRANGVAGRLGRNHHHIEIIAGHDLTVMHVEAVGEGQRGAFLDVRLDLALVGGSDMLIGHQHHDEIGAFHG